MTSRAWAPVLAFAVLLGACGDGGTGPNTPDLTRADVAGIYDMTELSFDPQGSLPSTDLLARLDAANLPQLVVSSNKDSVQLIFREPGGLFRTPRGSYVLGDDDITITMANASEPGELLLPRTLTYEFDGAAETLSFAGLINADTTRLFALVPEWSDEPVVNPLPGTLTVEFTRD